jgi:hypothetical protein
MLTKEGAKGLIKEPSEVDKFIKTTVVGDAIKLMKRFKGESRAEVDRYRSW